MQVQMIYEQIKAWFPYDHADHRPGYIRTITSHRLGSVSI